MHERIYKTPFAKVYPLYIRKAEAKGRTKAEVDAIIFWLTGYDARTLKRQLDREADFETFYGEAPRFNPDAAKITGVVCGVRVEEIEDPLAQRLRYLDKLIDELAKGRPMEKILRSDAASAPAAGARKAPARPPTKTRAKATVKARRPAARSRAR